MGTYEELTKKDFDFRDMLIQSDQTNDGFTHDSHEGKITRAVLSNLCLSFNSVC